MANPYLTKNLIKLKIALPCSKEKAWKLIATRKGLTSWFPISCQGKIAERKTITLRWWGTMSGSSTHHQVFKIKRGSYLEMEWPDKARVRYTIEDKNPVAVKIEATYPKTKKGKATQLLELAPWVFAITNLKSIAAGGIDLRNHSTNPKFSWQKGFVD